MFAYLLFFIAVLNFSIVQLCLCFIFSISSKNSVELHNFFPFLFSDSIELLWSFNCWHKSNCPLNTILFNYFFQTKHSSNSRNQWKNLAHWKLQCLEKIKKWALTGDVIHYIYVFFKSFNAHCLCLKKRVCRWNGLCSLFVLIALSFQSYHELRGYSGSSFERQWYVH